MESFTVPVNEDSPHGAPDKGCSVMMSWDVVMKQTVTFSNTAHQCFYWPTEHIHPTSNKHELWPEITLRQETLEFLNLSVSQASVEVNGSECKHPSDWNVMWPYLSREAGSFAFSEHWARDETRFEIIFYLKTVPQFDPPHAVGLRNLHCKLFVVVGFVKAHRRYTRINWSDVIKYVFS